MVNDIQRIFLPTLMRQFHVLDKGTSWLDLAIINKMKLNEFYNYTSQVDIYAIHR